MYRTEMDLHAAFGITIPQTWSQMGALVPGPRSYAHDRLSLDTGYFLH